MNLNKNEDTDESDFESEDDLVDIGLIQENDQSELTKLSLRSSTLYPCKMGGKPQWLHLNNTPTDLNCVNCKTQLKFLLQIYAPLNNQQDDNNGFHRYLYVFICASDECVNEKRTIKVLRSQMNRQNDTYSYAAPPVKSNENINSIRNYLHDFYKNQFERNSYKFCNVCGISCNKRCAKCGFISYCSETHQRLDWIELGHKRICNEYVLSQNIDEKVNIYLDKEICKDLNSFLYPEYEILIEQEELDEDDQEDIDQKKIDEQLEMNKELDKDLEALPESEYDEDFLKFKKRIKSNPKQVIRYDRCGEPLWCTKNNKLDKEPSNCEVCKSKRVFEFQIMPQLLNYLNINEDLSILNTLDWAGIYIYTCEKNCATKEYVEEFVFKQDYS